MRKLHLSDEERAFCALVTTASLANHFSRDREKADRAIAGVSDALPLTSVREVVRERVTGFVESLECDGRGDLRLYEGRDEELLRYTMLFEIFHRFMPDMDALIERQAQTRGRSLVVGFGDEAMEAFTRRGFPTEEARLYMGIFYQLRRLFYFVERRLVGTSRCMQRFRSDLWANVVTDDPVFYKEHLVTHMEDFSTLLLGETGTGKGSAAAAIGRSGFIPYVPQKRQYAENFADAFIAINLSQYPAGLIESELFGHRKGAFTGAVESHEGVFARCSAHGSIFLDEIGEVSIPVQIKLLQVLQDRTFSPVGSHERHRFSGRVVAATNRDVDRLRREERFRDDFYYRLCSDIIVIPPLRQRISEDPSELKGMVNHLVAQITGVQRPDIVEKTLNVIKTSLGDAYPWPGNVRELEQCVRRILLKSAYQGDRRRTTDPMAMLCEDMTAEAVDASSLLARYCGILYERHGTYEAVSRIAGVDRRTAKKYVGGEG